MIRDKSGSGDNSQTLWLYAGTEFNKKRQASLYTEYRGNKVIRGNKKWFLFKRNNLCTISSVECFWNTCFVGFWSN